MIAVNSAVEISVIITTRNEEHNITNCLESIKTQSYPQDKIEIIVVDNNSTDRTKEIARRFIDKVYNFGPERAAQRNFGIKQAKGKYILYLDADMILSKNVIQECVTKCENEGYIALYIPERIVNMPLDHLNNLCLPHRSKATLRGNQSFNLCNQSYWTRVRDFERSFYNTTAIDCVRFIRKDKFLEIGGFDLSLTGPEDWDFDRRIKETGKVDIIDAPLYHNEGEFNLKKYLKKKGYYTRFLNQYIQKWGRNDPIIKKQLGLRYRLFGVFLENGKWKRLIRHPILAASMYFLRFMVGLKYLI